MCVCARACVRAYKPAVLLGVSLLPLFLKSKSRLMRLPCCLCVYLYVYPPVNFLMPEPISVKLRMHTMAPEPLSTAYFINPISLCACICIPPIVTRQRLSKHFPAATNTHNRRIGRVVFCAVRVVSKESLWVCLCISLSLLGNGLVNTFLRQRRIGGGFVFYAVRVVLKESRRTRVSAW
jgi:hypothetical protein